jgi:hypothetical protein
VANQEQARAIGGIAIMRRDEVITVLFLPLKACRKTEGLETLL